MRPEIPHSVMNIDSVKSNTFPDNDEIIHGSDYSQCFNFSQEKNWDAARPNY